MRRLPALLIVLITAGLMAAGFAMSERVRAQDNSMSSPDGRALYRQYCMECHAEDGRGMSGIAPALNNPQYFGHDYLSPYNKKLLMLYQGVDGLSIDRIIQNRETWLATPGNAPAEAEKQQLIENLSYLNHLLNIYQSKEYRLFIGSLDRQRQDFIHRAGMATYHGYLPRHDSYPCSENGIGYTLCLARDSNRLLQAGFTSFNMDIRAYTRLAIVAGRPGTQELWDGQIMPPFSGRLTDAEIDAITDYVMQWDRGDDWNLGALLAVRQFARIPVDYEWYRIYRFSIDSLFAGNPVNGEKIFNGEKRGYSGYRLPCSACHTDASKAPPVEKLWIIAQEQLKLPQFKDYSTTHYIYESLVNPDADIVPGYESVEIPMPAFGEKLAAQDYADIMAYLESFTHSP